MITAKNLTEQVDANLSVIDNTTLDNLLELIDMKMNEVWWINYPTYNIELSITNLEEEQLTFDQVKELYPHWFNEVE